MWKRLKQKIKKDCIKQLNTQTRGKFYYFNRYLLVQKGSLKTTVFVFKLYKVFLVL